MPGHILVFHVQFLMERLHDHVIVQLSAHEMQRTRISMLPTFTI